MRDKPTQIRPMIICFIFYFALKKSVLNGCKINVVIVKVSNIKNKSFSILNPKNEVL